MDAVSFESGEGLSCVMPRSLLWIEDVFRIHTSPRFTYDAAPSRANRANGPVPAQRSTVGLGRYPGKQCGEADPENSTSLWEAWRIRVQLIPGCRIPFCHVGELNKFPIWLAIPHMWGARF